MSDDKTGMGTRDDLKGDVTPLKENESKFSIDPDILSDARVSSCTTDTTTIAGSIQTETALNHSNNPLPVNDMPNPSYPPNVTISAGAPIFTGRNLHYHPYHNAMRHPYYVTVPPSQAPTGTPISGAAPVPYSIHMASQIPRPMLVRRFSSPADFQHPAHFVGHSRSSSYNMAVPQAASPPNQPSIPFWNATKNFFPHDHELPFIPATKGDPKAYNEPAHKKIDSDVSTHPIFVFSSSSQDDKLSAFPGSSYPIQQDSPAKSTPIPSGPAPNYTAGYGSNLLDSTVITNSIHGIGGLTEQQSECSSYRSRRKKLLSSSETASSSKTETPPNAHHFLMPASEAKKIISTLTWQEKTVYVARHFLGGRTVNGFLQATSMARRYKKRRARQLTRHAYSRERSKEDVDFGEVERLLADESEDQVSSDSKITDAATEELLKKITMNEYMSRRLVAEMAFGVTYCETLASIIESILEEISPFKRLPGVLDEHETVSCTIQESCRNDNMDSVPASTSLIVSDPSLANLKEQSIAMPQCTVSTALGQDQDRRPGSSALSTLRSLRDKKRKKIEYPSLEGIQSVISISNKNERMHRVFSINRFRPLQIGDYVAVRPSSQDVWILSRVVTEWQLPSNVSLVDIVDMTISKRDSIFSAKKVQVQEYDDYGSTTPSTIKIMSRSAVVPLWSNSRESNQFASFLMKGARVYAMYPCTTALYPATVVDSTTYCQGDNDIVVVEFDGDEDDLNVKTPKHIPSRFVTLIPIELESSSTSKKIKTLVGGSLKLETPRPLS